MKTSRNRSIASLGESLTAEDTLQQQKEIEDEKKRKHMIREERTKENGTRIKGNEKEKGKEIQTRRSDRSKKRRVEEENTEICGVCTVAWSLLFHQV